MGSIAKAIGRAMTTEGQRTEKERTARYIASIRKHIAWEEEQIRRHRDTIRKHQEEIKELNG